jgi:large subunit ribosomal protein L1
VKSDATVDLHIRLSVDPKQADQNIRDSVILPAGTGKSVRIAAFVDDNDRLQAIDSGADLAGETEITKELNSGKFSFNVLLSTPNMMPKLGKFARVLGPRGLMPNPKSGTVTNDIIKAISESKTGKVEYRVDSNGIIHLGIGKVSFKPNQLLENLQAVLGSIQANKPSSLKNNYIMSAYLSTSMGPSIKLDI